METFRLILRRGDGSLIGPHKRTDNIQDSPVVLEAKTRGEAVLFFFQRVYKEGSGTYDFEDFNDLASIEVEEVRFP